VFFSKRKNRYDNHSKRVRYQPSFSDDGMITSPKLSNGASGGEGRCANFAPLFVVVFLGVGCCSISTSIALVTDPFIGKLGLFGVDIDICGPVKGPRIIGGKN
jgi:hypothetical protein